MLERAMGAEVKGSLVHCKNEKKLLEYQKDTSKPDGSDVDVSPATTAS
jgi:hypothetical protein